MSHHVLIVDDDELVLTGLASSLEREGYRITTALSGREAVAILPDAGVDAILADMVMDDMDGLALLDYVRNRHPDVPVLILTGHGTAENALAAMRRGAADYIQKPARAEEIARRIIEALDARLFQQRLKEQHATDRERRALHHARAERRSRMKSLCDFAEGLGRELTATLGGLKAGADAGNDEARKRLARLAEELNQLCPREKLDLRPADLNGVVRAYLESPQFRAQADASQAVHVDFRPGELPQVEISPAHVRTALDAVVSVFLAHLQNQGRLLIQTSHDYVADDGDHYDVLPAAHYTVLQVRCNKPLPAEQVDRFFEPFFLPSAPGAAGPGGLGLALALVILRRHGGGIALDTDANFGTECRMYFPAHAAEPRAAAPAAEGRDLVALVVDDESAHGRAAEQVLAELGFTSQQAGNGDAALNLVRQRKESGEPPFAVILIDLFLGQETDGVELYRRILEFAPDQKAILGSGFADLGRLQEGRKLGLRHHIRKPYTRENLGRAIRAVLAEK